MAVATAVREHARRDIVRLVHRGLGVEAFARAATRILARAVPADGTCLLTMDPATLLPTAEVVENGLPAPAVIRLTEIELREPDVNKFVALARGPRPAASLSHVTAGDLDRSLRQRELRRPSGFEDELRAVLAGGTGAWGALTLMREAKRPHFTPAEVRFVASLAGALADGLRRASLLSGAPVGRGAIGDRARADADAGEDADAGADAGGHAGAGADAEAGGDAGLLVLGGDGTVEMANRAADRWLDELEAGDRPGAGLPLVVHAVADRARQAAEDGAGVARARVRTPAGRWVVVRGSLLGDGPGAPVGVLLEPARPPDLAPLIVEAYGFTDRERRVTELVAQGFSTSQIADRLHLSAYTVQDHLKSIFDKSGTGSRGDLVARLFFDHYAPRLTSPPGTG